MAVLETSPNKLDPAFVVDVSEGTVCSMIFQGLVRFSPGASLVPDAAESWSIENNGKKYVFHLDSRMRFSNGRRLTASDVDYSFKRLLSKETLSPRRWVLQRIKGAPAYASGSAGSIEGLHAPDDSTVIIELEEAFRPMLQLLAMPGAMIIPREEADSSGGDFAASPVGSGPWKLASWQRGDEIVLVPNKFNPLASGNLDKIRIRIIPEDFTRIAEFESGELDILKIPFSELERFLRRREDRARIQEVTDLRVAYIGLNNQKRAFKDIRVRKALNMAVDVERIIDVVLQGQAVKASGAVPPGLAGFKKRETYQYDPELAKKLLAEAGYGAGLTFEIWQRDSPVGNLVCEAVQGYLRKIDVEAVLVKREWSAFKEAVSLGKVDAFFLDWYADYPDAENFLFPLFHSSNAGGGGNRVFFKNPEVDRMITLAQHSPAAESAKRLYEQTDSLVYAEAPWIFLYFPKSFYAVSPDVEGYHAPALYLGEDFLGVSKR